MRLVKGKSVYKLPPNDGVVAVFVKETRSSPRNPTPEFALPMVRIGFEGPAHLALGGAYFAVPDGRELRIIPTPARNGRLTVIYRPLPRAA